MAEFDDAILSHIGCIVLTVGTWKYFQLTHNSKKNETENNQENFQEGKKYEAADVGGHSMFGYF